MGLDSKSYSYIYLCLGPSLNLNIRCGRWRKTNNKYILVSLYRAPVTIYIYTNCLNRVGVGASLLTFPFRVKCLVSPPPSLPLAPPRSLHLRFVLSWRICLIVMTTLLLERSTTNLSEEVERRSCSVRPTHTHTQCAFARLHQSALISSDVFGFELICVE